MLTIPFLKAVQGVRVYFKNSADILRKMQEVMDSPDTPTFRRLRIGSPQSGWPTFTSVHLDVNNHQSFSRIAEKRIHVHRVGSRSTPDIMISFKKYTLEVTIHIV